jgi:hypothetical protein
LLVKNPQIVTKVFTSNFPDPLQSFKKLLLKGMTTVLPYLDIFTLYFKVYFLYIGSLKGGNKANARAHPLGFALFEARREAILF